MTVIQKTTFIDAPIATCFRLSLSIDLELDATQQYGIRAVNGVTKGIIGLGERVTWKTKQFGITVAHTSEITCLEEPVYFQDAMVRGIFRSFRHDHFFRSLDLSKTEMRDELHFSMPRILTGQIAERLFIRRRLSMLLAKRNILIKDRAEIESYNSSASLSTN